MSQAEELKKKILEDVRRYYLQRWQEEPFLPGKTPVPYAGRVFDEKELVNLVDASLEFWLTSGSWTARFESLLGKFLDVPHCHMVNSGSSANLLAFMALTSDTLKDRKVHRGDEIITVAAGFPTTVAPIVLYGAVPVFVDITPGTCNIDCEEMEEALTPLTRGVMLAHTLGNPFDIQKVTSFCEKHGLWLIEDNCDSLGALYGGRHTGTFGDLATSSFYPPHHITTGEGGAVYTGNSELSRIVLSMRDWGRDCICPSGVDDTCGQRFSQQFGSLPTGYDHKYVYSHFGYNLKATDLQASIGCAQLEKLPLFVRARRSNFETIHEGLRNLEDLFILPEPAPGSEPSWFGFLLTVRPSAPFSRDEIVAHVERNGIQTRMLFAGNLTRQPCFEQMRSSGSGYRSVSRLANTDMVMKNSFWFGIYPGLDEDRIGYIINTIRSFVDRRGKK